MRRYARERRTQKCNIRQTRESPMSPENQLLLGCFLLSLVTTLYIRTLLRPKFLQQDLAVMGVQFRELVDVKDEADHPKFREFLDNLDLLIRNPEILSLPALKDLADFVRRAGDEKEDCDIKRITYNELIFLIIKIVIIDIN